METDEKRSCPRLVLGMDDGYFGSFIYGNDGSLIAQIVNLSAGGLNMAAPADATQTLHTGDVLLLARIVGGTSLSFISQIKAEIRWIKPLDRPGYVFIGCRFLDLADDSRRQLVAFVDGERIARGQYN